MKAINIKKTILLVAVTLFTVSIKAQQDPHYTQYMYNMNVINPAYAGSYDVLSLNFLARTQWVGIDGAPETYTLSAHSPIGKNVGLGISVLSDQIGPLKDRSVFADFSYTLKMSEDAKLALGLKAGFSFLDVPLPFLSTTNPGDVAFQNQINKAVPNFGFGAFYHTEKFYAGLSIPNLLKTVHYEKSNGAVSQASDEMHYFLTTGYVFNLSEDVKLKPSILAKAANGTPLSLDFSGNVLFNEKFELGLSYRLDESISALVNVRARKNLRIGYAYDYTISNLGNFNSGSHEIFLLFNFDFDRNKIKSPRFF